jgi:hypothetical protein
MDRQSLLTAAPRDLLAMSAVQQHAAVLAFVESVLDAIARDGREPDEWEGPDLAAALGYVLVGWNRAGMTVAVRSITEANQRGERADVPQGEAPMTLRVLRDRLDTLRQIGSRQA